jgi:hypothetical protein
MYISWEIYLLGIKQQSLTIFMLFYEQKIKFNGIFHDKIICELKLTNQNAILFLYHSFAK